MTETPEDIATLYSRARIEWTRYWDFSASRKQVRRQLHLEVAPEPLEWPTQPKEEVPQAQLQQFEIEHAKRPHSEEPPQVQTKEDQAAEMEPQALQPQPEAEQPTEQQTEPFTQPTPGAATRWYALRSIFTPAQATLDPSPFPQPEQRPPIVVVFSLAGGVGKTCLVATLGRLLSALGEHVLLAETAVCGLLPFYFGSRELRPGVIRTFFPPGPFGEENDAPVQMLNLQGDGSPGGDSQQNPFPHDPLLGELLRHGRGASRIVVDVATADRHWLSRLLSLRPTLVVPILPDMSSVACLGSLEALVAHPSDEEKPFYLLNQFDASSPLHRDVRALLQQQLGDRLLPFVLRRSSLVSEALAEGMTVIDYAPGSEIAADYQDLNSWLRNLAAPAMAGSSLRWSER